MIVRWSLDELPAVLLQLGIDRPFLVASPRWEAPVEVVGRWSEIPSDRAHVESLESEAINVSSIVAAIAADEPRAA